VGWSLTPPLLQPASHPLHPRHSSNPQNCISISSLCPHVPASDRFTSWLSPFGIAQMNTEALCFPPEVIICKRLIMARCMLPRILKNYAASLSWFTRFCDNFGILEVEHMPASKSLLSTFVTTHGAGSVNKGSIKSWLLGVVLWHCINHAPWFGSSDLEWAVSGAARLTPNSSNLNKRDPVMIQHLHALRRHLDLSNSFDIAVFAIACIMFWCCCR